MTPRPDAQTDHRTDRPDQPLDPIGLTQEQFAAAAARAVGPGTARAAYADVFRAGVRRSGCARAEIAPVVRRMEEQSDEGPTVKFVQRLAPTATGRLPSDLPLDIESVLIPMIGKLGARTHTLCVSSQVGCAMGCGFCETAQMGLVRSLTPAEIVGQWWAATHVVPRILGWDAAPPAGSGRPTVVDNIVFMGMGEPLDNLDAVLQSIACLTDHRGAGVPMSKITISTVGRVDGLWRLADVVSEPGWKRLGIALSVNAPNDAIRDSIMPLNRRWNMAELREVMVELVRRRGSRKILFEYVLIPGVNDRPEHARELAEWLGPFARTEARSHVGLLNVIPYNPRRDSPWPAPTEASVDRFVQQLAALGVFVKRRRTKGRSLMGACGQLGTADIRRRRYVPLTTAGGSDDA